MKSLGKAKFTWRVPLQIWLYTWFQVVMKFHFILASIILATDIVRALMLETKKKIIFVSKTYSRTY